VFSGQKETQVLAKEWMSKGMKTENLDSFALHSFAKIPVPSPMNLK